MYSSNQKSKGKSRKGKGFIDEDGDVLLRKLFILFVIPFITVYSLPSYHIVVICTVLDQKVTVTSQKTIVVINYWLNVKYAPDMF